MKHYQIMPRNWFLVEGKPRPVVAIGRNRVYVQHSSERPHANKISSGDLIPLPINEELIAHSNLRCQHHEEDNVYDSLRLKHETIDLPFTLRFCYDEEEPCEIIFSTGYTIWMKHIHRLQQFVHALTGEELRIKMKFTDPYD